MSFGRISTPLLPIVVLPFVLMMGAPASAGPSNGHYVGAGVRAGFDNGTGLAINGKLQVKELGDRWSLSLRPTLILDRSTEMRAAFTAEAAIGRVSPYFGGGLAYNTHGSQKIDPMLSAGIDVRLHRNFVVRVGGNYIFQDDEPDTEMLVTGNYAF